MLPQCQCIVVITVCVSYSKPYSTPQLYFYLKHKNLDNPMHLDCMTAGCSKSTRYTQRVAPVRTYTCYKTYTVHYLGAEKAGRFSAG